MYTFNVSITTVQGLKNVSLKDGRSCLYKVGAVYSKHAGKMTKFNYM
jgi:hypothetical protein